MSLALEVIDFVTGMVPGAIVTHTDGDTGQTITLAGATVWEDATDGCVIHTRRGEVRLVVDDGGAFITPGMEYWRDPEFTVIRPGRRPKSFNDPVRAIWTAARECDD